jgi:hypothetical protein
MCVVDNNISFKNYGTCLFGDVADEGRHNGFDVCGQIDVTELQRDCDRYTLSPSDPAVSPILRT